MSIDNCQGCDKRLDTDFVEYQEDGALYCDTCLDEREEAGPMQPSKEQIEAAARLVPERMAPEFGEGMAWNEYRDDARPWQPWAETEAGRSDALVLDTAVRKWRRENDIRVSNDLFDAWTDMVYMADYSGDLAQRQAATFAAAAAIGAHIKGVEGE